MQYETPCIICFYFSGLGDCFFWAISDQLRYDNVLSLTRRDFIGDINNVNLLRTAIVGSVTAMIDNGKFSEDFFVRSIDGNANDLVDGTKENWAAKMIKPTIWADERVYELASLLLKRTIIFYPVIPEGWVNGRRHYHPEYLLDGEPLHLLYFSELKFISGHFQSIRPRSSLPDNQIGDSPFLATSNDNQIPSSSTNLPSSRNTLPSSKNTLPSSRNTLSSRRNNLSSSRRTIPSRRNTLASSRNRPYSRNSFANSRPSTRNSLPSSNNPLPSSNNPLPSSRDNNLSPSDWE